MSVTKLITSCHKVSDLLKNISQEFTINCSQVILHPDEDNGLEFVVTIPSASLNQRSWSHKQYKDFCDKNHLNGTMCSGFDNTIIFSMIPSYPEEIVYNNNDKSVFHDLTHQEIDAVIKESSLFKEEDLTSAPADDGLLNIDGQPTEQCYYVCPEQEHHDDELKRKQKELEDLDKEIETLFSQNIIIT